MIRLLCADLSSADGQAYQRLYQRASAERKRRADRYRRREDKLRCVAAEALLRIALGRDDFRIGKNAYGKPYLPDFQEVHFNISHSGRYVIVACGDAEVGVDVQQHHGDMDLPAIAARCFTPDERQYVGENDPGQLQRFYEIWTGKESYLKYTGEGLRRNMQSFSVLQVEPQVRHLYYLPDTRYSLSLCAVSDDEMFDLLDVQQVF